MSARRLTQSAEATVDGTRFAATAIATRTSAPRQPARYEVKALTDVRLGNRAHDIRVSPVVAEIARDATRPRTREWVLTSLTRSFHPSLADAVTAAAKHAAQDRAAEPAARRAAREGSGR